MNKPEQGRSKTARFFLLPGYYHFANGRWFGGLLFSVLAVGGLVMVVSGRGTDNAAVGLIALIAAFIMNAMSVWALEMSRMLDNVNQKLTKWLYMEQLTDARKELLMRLNYMLLMMRIEHPKDDSQKLLPAPEEHLMLPSVKEYMMLGAAKMENIDKKNPV